MGFYVLFKRRRSCWLNLNGTFCSPDPQFAGAAIIPSSHKVKEEMYFFFSEFNKTARVDEEPYKARIGRICTVRSCLELRRFTISASHLWPPGGSVSAAIGSG